MSEVDPNLFILACQSIPVLCRQKGIDSSLPSDLLPWGTSEVQERELMENRRRTLAELFSVHSVTWWDIFDRSEIGRERNVIAEKYVQPDATVLDVGCGRGYFTFACARRARSVVGIDKMDDAQRMSWWENFLKSRASLGIGSRVDCVKSTGISLPFNSNTFALAASVHALRNFSAIDARQTLEEMRRVLRPGGIVIVAESTNQGTTRAHENYLNLHHIRTVLGFELPLSEPHDLENWCKEAGFRHVSTDYRDFGLHYAPLAFRLEATAKENPGNLETEYRTVTEQSKTFGNQETPVLIMSGEA